MKALKQLSNAMLAVINNGDLPVQTFNKPGAPQEPLLTPAKRELLEQCEAAIRKGMAYIFEVGAALTTIRDEALYLDAYKTFEEYCEDRWKVVRSQAYRWINAARVVQYLSPIGDKVPMPVSEYQIRALGQSNLGADDIRTIWMDAVAAAPSGRVTGNFVAQKIARLRTIRGESGENPPAAKRPSKLNLETVRGWGRQVSYAQKAVERGDADHAAELLGDLRRRLAEIVNGGRIIISKSVVDYEI